MARLLFVYGSHGPPLDYVLPRLRAHGDLYVYLGAEPNPVHQALLDEHALAYVGRDAAGANVDDDDLRRKLVEVGRALRADAVVTFDECLTVPVADAARELGLRGAGPNVRLTRDKLSMRRAFAAAGVPAPKFELVTDRGSLEHACSVLEYPFVLKAATGAASLGRSVARYPKEALRNWERARETVSAFVAEEIVQGSTASWYDGIEGYGTDVSVEGIVCGGRYHPVAITARLPNIPPFTEVGNQTPCVLSAEQQEQIAQAARAAVDALQLDFCGTHTDVKLLANRELCVIETAARFSGCTTVPQLERVYGVDMIGLVVELLLHGRSDRLPPAMFVGRGNGAAGALALLPADSDGTPWPTRLVFNDDVPWTDLVSPATRVHVDRARTVTGGTAIAPYDPHLGGRNCFGMLYLESDSPETLVADQYATLRGIRRALEERAYSELFT